MGRERTSGSGLETELAKHKGIEIHGGNLRVVFMWRRIRCRESLGLPITKANIKHAALLRAAILHEIKTGHFDYGRHFPNSKHATNYSSAKDERLGALLERYKPLKAVDITPMTEEKYGYALDICTALVGIDRLAGVLLPEDIQLLRTVLISDRAPSTVNHYLATFAGFLGWCETNGYCRKGLSEACNRFALQGQEPDPLTRDEFQLLIDKGCLHSQDSAAITLAVYTGLRPGELCALAVEDIDLAGGQINITRAITANGTFKVPKTGKPRSVLSDGILQAGSRGLVLEWATAASKERRIDALASGILGRFWDGLPAGIITTAYLAAPDGEAHLRIESRVARLDRELADFDSLSERLAAATRAARRSSFLQGY